MSVSSRPSLGLRHSSLPRRTSARTTAIAGRLLAAAALAGALTACSGGSTSPTGPRQRGVEVRGVQAAPTDSTARSGYQNPMV